MFNLMVKRQVSILLLVALNEMVYSAHKLAFKRKPES
jgi:hypothetical protein